MDFFPVLFVVPRVVGWLAHWRQMMLQEGGVKIWRPRQVCTLENFSVPVPYSLILGAVGLRGSGEAGLRAR